MTHLTLLITALFFMHIGPHTQALAQSPLKIIQAHKVTTDQFSKLKTHTVEVLDPVQSTKSQPVRVKYQAYLGTDVFDLAFGGRDAWSKKSMIGFKCADGFQPILPVKDFAQGQFYFAFARHDGQKFVAKNQSKKGKQEKLSPYYIIWTSAEKQQGRHQHFWPYKVVGLYLQN